MDEKRRIAITIAYDGSSFYGWQKQPEFPTVQGEIERALEEIFGIPIEIEGTGRTDRGVHAYGQCATFDAPMGIPVEKIPYALTNLLPGGIRIVKAEEVARDFHARFNAKAKTYRYKILTEVTNPQDGELRAREGIFLRNNCYYVAGPLSVEDMKVAAKHIEGTHDFASFQASGGEEKESTVRTVYEIKINETNVKNAILDEEGSAKLITVDVRGDGFLYNMVRIIAGSLVDVGLGKIYPDDMKDIVESCDRSKAGHTAPAKGLYLMEVEFNQEDKHAGQET